MVLRLVEAIGKNILHYYEKDILDHILPASFQTKNMKITFFFFCFNFTLVSVQISDKL